MKTVLRTFNWFVFTVVLVLSLCVSILIYLRVGSERSSMSNRSLDMAKMTARIIQMCYLQDFEDISENRVTMDSPQYQRVFSLLAALKQCNPNVTFLYTFKFSNSGKTLVYLVDAEPSMSPERSVLGESESCDYPTLQRYYRRYEIPMASDTVEYDPRWGWFMSSYCPIVDARGSVVGHVAVDVNEHDVADAVSQVYVQYGLVGVTGGILVVLLAWSLLVMYSRRRVREMELCAERARKHAEKLALAWQERKDRAAAVTAEEVAASETEEDSGQEG